MKKKPQPAVNCERQYLLSGRRGKIFSTTNNPAAASATKKVLDVPVMELATHQVV